MKKLLCIVLTLVFGACACAEASDFLLPIGLPLGATVEDVTAMDPDLTSYDMSTRKVYVGYVPTELFGCSVDSHNYIFDENGCLIHYACGILPEGLTAFEDALKAGYDEMIPISADGTMLDYSVSTGELKEEYWSTVEIAAAAYAEDGLEIKHFSQYLAADEAGYVGIIIESLSMGEGADYFEFASCYFTRLNVDACEALAADPKIAG